MHKDNVDNTHYISRGTGVRKDSDSDLKNHSR